MTRRKRWVWTEEVHRDVLNLLGNIAFLFIGIGTHGPRWYTYAGGAVYLARFALIFVIGLPIERARSEVPGCPWCHVPVEEVQCAVCKGLFGTRLTLTTIAKDDPEPEPPRDRDG